VFRDQQFKRALGLMRRNFPRPSREIARQDRATGPAMRRMGRKAVRTRWRAPCLPGRRRNGVIRATTLVIVLTPTGTPTAGLLLHRVVWRTAPAGHLGRRLSSQDDDAGRAGTRGRST